MTRVFISYRRDDCAGHAGRLYDHLVERFGDDAVFMDIDAIEPGVDFGERIEHAIGSCSVLIALIGDDWLDIKDSAGRRRLDNPADLVRLEIALALRRSDLPVIPVLVEGAAMPQAEQLPEDLQPLARRNALELSDGRWRYDADRLIEVVERRATPGSPPPRFGGQPGEGGRGPVPVSEPLGRRVPARALASGGAIAAVIAAGAVVVAAGGGDDGAPGDGGPDRPSTPSTPTRPSLSADPPIPTVTRPLALALRGDHLVVLGGPGDLRVADADTGEERRPRVRNLGAGASDVAVGFGSLWVTKHRTRSLLRIKQRTRRAVRSGYIPRTPGMPVAVATGHGAVWLGTDEPSGPDHVIKVRPDGAIAQVVPVAGKIYDVAVGAGAVWVTTSAAKVVRISVRNGARHTIDVGREPHGLAIGAGAVWVANWGDKSITRIDAKTRRPGASSISLNYRPERVAVGGGSVWVTARDANKLIRIDPRRSRVEGMIDTGLEPYAVGVNRGRVWMTLVEDDAIQRVRFKR